MIRVSSLITIYLIAVFVQVPLTGVFFKSNQVVATILFAALDFVVFLFFLKGALRSRLMVYFSYQIALFVYLLWCILSVTWSISVDYLYNFMLVFKECLRIAVFVSIAAYVGITTFSERFFKAAVYSAAVFGLLALPSLDFIVEYGGGTRAMYEGYRDSVGVGRPASLLCLLSAIAYFSGYVSFRKALLCILPCMAVVFLCFSKSSIGALILSLFLVYGLDYKNKKKSLMIMAIIFSSALLIVFLKADYISDYLNFSGPGGASNLTGRADIWFELFSFKGHNFFVGNGINSVHPIVTIYGLKAGTAHNEIIQQIISYGIIGLLLCIFVYVRVFNSYQRCIDTSLGKGILSIFLFFVIVGCVESVIAATVFPPYLIAFCLMLFLVDRQNNTV